MNAQIIEGQDARSMSAEKKWSLLSPYLRDHGREALSYATLQSGMDYLVVEGMGYIAYGSTKHPVLAPKGLKVMLVDPICAASDAKAMMELLLAHCPRVMMGPISQELAALLRPMGFKVGSIGYEPVLPVQTYNTKGDWKGLDLIRRARNEAKRRGVTVREEKDIRLVGSSSLREVSQTWLQTKILKDREIWFYARPPVFEPEPEVRKFVAYDPTGKAVGFVFYDPYYRDGKVIGYADNTSRCDEQNFGKLSTVVHMAAIETFKSEGAQWLNLCLAPFDKVDEGEFNDDLVTKVFLKTTRRYGENVYNFGGLAFFKSKFRGQEIQKYYASNAAAPSNDIYLAYHMAGMVDGYFGMFGDFLSGVATGLARDAASSVRKLFTRKRKATSPTNRTAS